MIYVYFWILLGSLFPVLGWVIGWAANMDFFWWEMVRDQDRGAYVGFCGSFLVICYAIAFFLYVEWKKEQRYD